MKIIPNSKYNTRDITTPASGLVVLMNSYWMCLEGDPKQALFYGKAPQCNSNKHIVEGKFGVERSDIKALGNVSIEFVEVAYVPERD